MSGQRELISACPEDFVPFGGEVWKSGNLGTWDLDTKEKSDNVNITAALPGYQ
jgi:hypothetical protein